MKQVTKYKKILFVDFNGIISYDNYWKDLEDKKHPLYIYKEKIEHYLFKDSPQTINDWMLGKYTSEDIHHILEKEVGVPYSRLYPIFVKNCKDIDVSNLVLNKLKPLKNKFYCILSTGNMDCFNRFIIPKNPLLVETFDEINNSFDLAILKTTNNGQYFKEKAEFLNVELADSIVIDDSKKVCKVFDGLGGTSYNCYGESNVIKILEEISKIYK